MSDDNLSFSVEVPQGTVVAAKLLGISGRLDTEMYLAMTDIEELLITDAQSFMAWKNPSGDLEESIYTDSYVPDSWHAVVGSALPYARRREYGFYDMMDSLGRIGKDLGEPYLEPALDFNMIYIEDRIDKAVNNAMPSGS